MQEYELGKRLRLILGYSLINNRNIRNAHYRGPTNQEIIDAFAGVFPSNPILTYSFSGNDWVVFPCIEKTVINSMVESGEGTITLQKKAFESEEWIDVEIPGSGDIVTLEGEELKIICSNFGNVGYKAVTFKYTN